jgi:YD repeat-containing protein
MRLQGKASPRANVWIWTTLLALMTLAGGGLLRAADQLTYAYDVLGRLQSVTYPNGTTVQYKYDAAGNRMQVTNIPPDSISVSVSVRATSATSLSASWSATDNDGYGITSYDLYRDGTLLESGTTATSYADTGLEPQTTYTYEVIAHDAGGTSGSGTASGQTLPPDAVSVSVSVQAVSASTSLLISWSATDGYGDSFQGYDLYRNGTLLVSDISATSYTDANLGSGTTYTYEVVAHDTDGTTGSGSASGQTNYQISSSTGGATTSMYTTRIVPADCGPNTGYGPCTFLVQQAYGSGAYVRQDSGPTPSGPWTNNELTSGYQIGAGLATYASPSVYGH